MASEIAEDLDPTGPISDGARLRAQGATVRLRDGLHRLVFDYEAFEQLEEDFVDIETVAARLSESGYASKRLQFIRKVIAAAMLHEKPESMAYPEFQASVRKRLEVGRLSEYLDGLIYALAEAFPAFKIAEAVPKVTGGRSSSRGNASTTSPPSYSDEPIESSGG